MFAYQEVRCWWHVRHSNTGLGKKLLTLTTSPSKLSRDTLSKTSTVAGLEGAREHHWTAGNTHGVLIWNCAFTAATKRAAVTRQVESDCMADSGWMCDERCGCRPSACRKSPMGPSLGCTPWSALWRLSAGSGTHDGICDGQDAAVAEVSVGLCDDNREYIGWVADLL